jgi:hypothetical protein
MCWRLLKGSCSGTWCFRPSGDRELFAPWHISEADLDSECIDANIMVNLRLEIKTMLKIIGITLSYTLDTYARQWHVAWKFWNEMNVRVFRHISTLPSIVLAKIKVEARNWVTAGAKYLSCIIPGEYACVVLNGGICHPNFSETSP